MKTIKIFLFLVPLLSLLGQHLPTDYSLDSRKLGKTADETPSSNSVERILLLDNVIYLATDGGLSQSTDYGTSWTNYYNTKDFGTESISSVAYLNGVVWAATWHSYVLPGGTVDGEGSGLRYSTDQGKTWTTIAQPVDNPGDSVIVYGINRIRALPVTTAVQNFIYDVALTRNTVWIATKAGGLRKSTDMGVTWQRVVLPPDYLDSIKPTDTLKFALQVQAGKFGPEANLNQEAFSILAVDDNTIYAGTAGGINKSTDGGISWAKFNHLNQSKPISGNFILALQKNEFDNSICAGTWQANGSTEFYSASISRDGGASWDIYLSGEKIRDFGFKYFGTAGSYTNADIFAASETGVVFRSSNNGTTWITGLNIKDSQTGIGLNATEFWSVKTERRADETTDIWLGSNNGLARLNEQTGSFWNGTWKVFLASQKLQTSNETYAFPNPFSPKQEITKIKYALGSSSNVTIRILDFGMHLVKTVIQNAPRNSSGEYMENWDGKDESGKIVPNGVYFYRIDRGSGQPVFGKIMVIM